METYSETTKTNINETNDCVVRSFAIALGIEYIKAHSFCKDWLGRKRYEGVRALPNKLTDEKVVSQLSNMGFSIKPVNNKWYNKWLKKYLPMNVRRFSKTYNKGTYIVANNTHAWVIKDGEVKDWGSFKPQLQRTCMHAWEVKNNRQYTLNFTF